MDPAAGHRTFRRESKKPEEHAQMPNMKIGDKARARKINLNAMRSYPSLALAVLAIAAVIVAFGYQAAALSSVSLSQLRDAIGFGPSLL